MIMMGNFFADLGFESGCFSSWEIKLMGQFTGLLLVVKEELVNIGVRMEVYFCFFLWVTKQQ